jgi:hypothetical protein
MTFAETIRAAVDDFAINGYDSEQRLETWIAQIRAAAQADLVPEAQVEAELRDSLTQIYERLIERGEIMRRNPGVDRFTITRVRPELRAELQRRILASANLIKLNREEAIEATLRRFSGWAASVPPGGIGDRRGRRQATEQTRKELTKLGFQTRRVAIDQGHKFMSNLSQIIANDGGAIAGIWHQHYTRYPRHSHKQRDGKVYLIRNSWAHEAGLVKPGSAGYTDEITQPGEEVYCHCTFEYLYGFRRLPPDMLTDAGREKLAAIRAAAAA